LPARPKAGAEAETRKSMYEHTDSGRSIWLEAQTPGFQPITGARPEST
jgi:hypothetical protein